MTKEEIIEWLEKTIMKHIDSGLNEKETIGAMDLLASLKGWKVQHCSRQNRSTRDSRLNLIGKK